MNRCIHVFTLVIGLACTLSCTRDGQPNVASKELGYPEIQVSISGAVMNPGQYSAPARLSLGQILDLAGGIKGSGDFSIPPDQLVVKRISNNETNEWSIYFKDFNKGKWKDFAFRNGDEIIVPVYIF